MAKAKTKIVYIVKNDNGVDDYFLYKKKSVAIENATEEWVHDYETSFCKHFFERATGLKLKSGEVIELVLKRGKTVRKAS